MSPYAPNPPRKRSPPDIGRNKPDGPTHRQELLSLVVLISGRGSNLHAIIDAISRRELPAVIRAVISNRPDAPGLEIAANAAIPLAVVDRAGFDRRADFDAALLETVRSYQPELVVLAGFMHILSRAFVRHYDGRILNIHPSLLPEFPGLNTHRRVLQAGAREHGASVHFVTVALDGGPVAVRGRVPILPTDNAEILANRVLEVEHRIYPLAIRWFAEGRLRKSGEQALFDGCPLESPLDVKALPPDDASDPGHGAQKPAAP